MTCDAFTQSVAYVRYFGPAPLRVMVRAPLRPESVTRALAIGGRPLASLIVFPASLRANEMEILPRLFGVAFVARSASRSEVPSRPGFERSALIEPVRPLTTSAFVVTLTVAARAADEEGDARAAGARIKVVSATAPNIRSERRVGPINGRGRPRSPLRGCLVATFGFPFLDAERHYPIANPV